MINNTTLVGRLTKNPELKYTQSGIAVLSFNLAVERNYTNAQGEKETDFINCQAWRGTAETLSNFAVKGSLIGVTGNIQTRNYQNNEGQTIYVTEVVINNFQMLEPKSVTDERRNQAGGQNNYSNNQGQQQNYNNQNNQQNIGNMGGYKSGASQPRTSNNQSNFNNNQNNTDPFESTDLPEIDDDDLPF